MIIFYGRLILVALLVNSTVYAHEVKMIDQSKLIGESFKVAMKKNNIVFGKGFVVEEPVGVVRGAKGMTAANDCIYLYVPRNSVKKRNSKWILNDFFSQPVIGIAIQHNDQWNVYGQVIPFYHINHR